MATRGVLTMVVVDCIQRAYKQTLATGPEPRLCLDPF